MVDFEVRVSGENMTPMAKKATAAMKRLSQPMQKKMRVIE